MNLEADITRKAEKAMGSSTGWWSPDELRDLDPEVVLAAMNVIAAARALHALPPYTEAQGYLDALEDALAAWDALARPPEGA